jgi:ketosteroid isomerase-like protein
MTEENVEVVRAAFAAWNAGDMATLREQYDPSITLRAPEGWPEPGPFVGREAVMRQWEQMRGTWDTDAVEPISEFIDAADRVVVRYIWRGVGRGPESNIEVTAVCTVRKSGIVGIELFWDHAEALEAAGLRE